MSELERLLARLSADEPLRGRGFERLAKWVIENAPEYGARIGRVWLWGEWPGNEGRIDAGIDLVAEDREGGLWAIQAKHYDQAYAIRKADLDSFLSESSRREFSYRLLIATTDRLGSTARRTLAVQEKPVGMLMRSDLDSLGVVWPDSLAELRPSKPIPKKARPHQRRALREVVSGLRDADRGQVVMACGTGKTLVARFLHDELSARRTLVLVPSLSLLKQSLREWLSQGSLDYLAVCSDSTVTPSDADAVVSSTTELGVPVTTDPDEIGAFLRRRRGGVVFATYQSSPAVADAQVSHAPAFDLVVADEAHRCAGPEAGVFATVLDGKRIKARKRVFMTATPRYYTGRLRKEAQDAEWEIASMDDPARFGSVLHRLSFADAINQGLLSDYEVLVVGVTGTSYREMAERGVFVTADGNAITDARTLARQIGLLRAMRDQDLRRVVAFHNRIDGAGRFARELPEVCTWMPSDLRPTGRLWADHVSGQMTSGERENHLNRLRGLGEDERGVLTNARCLAEGVDVPMLDGVAFIEPRRSQTDIVQAVGRAIRKAANKTTGTVVVPVFVDEDADPEDALDASEFDRVWQVIKALRAHDEALAEELDQLRRELGRRGTTLKRPGKIKLDLPVAVGEEFARAFDSRLITETTRPWEFWYGLLERHIERTGHARVPSTYVEDGNRLGGWVTSQRHLYDHGRLDQTRVQRLEALPGWVWDANEADWERGYNELTEFVASNGHAQVPKSLVRNGYNLGSWAAVQRGRYESGDLSPERTARLESVDGWAWNLNDARWEEGFSYLRAFVNREGHARVPQSYRERTYPLGPWVNTQRLWRRDGRLSDDRVARLTALPGWTWDSADNRWEEGFSALSEFVSREGHARVAASHRENGYKLGQWVVVQRSFRVQRRLTQQRAVRLESLPGWTWSPKGEGWETAYAALEHFVAREGHARVPFKHSENGYALGRWVIKQRYNATRLSPERRARLESLPGWTWNTKARSQNPA
jgi:superfamily II DNA or RNA helicase